MKRVALAVTVLMLSACAISPEHKRPIAVVAVSVPQSDVELITSAIGANMKDPSSTMVKNMVSDKPEGDMYFVCGQVNGKNSYGGYVGYQPFSALLFFNRSNKQSSAAAVSVGRVAYMICQDKGLI